MTDQMAYGDPLSIPFWEAASRRVLVVQQCASCGHHQFYPRPFCLVCFADGLLWVPTAGTGFVYSQTTVMMGPDPYTVAIIELSEGPRLTSFIVGGDVAIGSPVRLTWQEREDAPPLPVFVGI